MPPSPWLLTTIAGTKTTLQSPLPTSLKSCIRMPPMPAALSRRPSPPCPRSAPVNAAAHCSMPLSPTKPASRKLRGRSWKPLLESTSLSAHAATLLAAARAGNPPISDLLALGEKHPSVFFREIIEPLADSFEPADVRVYETIIQPWLSTAAPVNPPVPDRLI